MIHCHQLEVIVLDKVDEDWEEEGVICPHCGTGFTNDAFQCEVLLIYPELSNDDALQNHIDKTGVKNGGFKELKRNKEDVLSGIKPHVCDECGLGFKFKFEGGN